MRCDANVKYGLQIFKFQAKELPSLTDSEDDDEEEPSWSGSMCDEVEKSSYLPLSLSITNEFGNLKHEIPKLL